jgi:hypothetical protein
VLELAQVRRYAWADEDPNLAHFDPLAIHCTPPPGETYPSWLNEEVLSDDALHATLLALLEQQASVTFHQFWLTTPQSTYIVRT